MRRKIEDLKNAAVTPRFFGVPSMNDSLEVKVLYPA
jgi:hypothetical protein